MKIGFNFAAEMFAQKLDNLIAESAMPMALVQTVLQQKATEAAQRAKELARKEADEYAAEIEAMKKAQQEDAEAVPVELAVEEGADNG